MIERTILITGIVMLAALTAAGAIFAPITGTPWLDALLLPGCTLAAVITLGGLLALAPTQQIPVLIDSAKTGELRFEKARWSLIPAWSDTLKLKYPTFNARAETLTTKSTWRKPLQTQRAIILARGFYEWTGEKGSKQPWFIHDPHSELLGLAGLYSWWPDRSKRDDDPDRWVLTATIVTSDAVQTLAGIHDRNPVILPEHMWLHWLDPSLVGDQALVDEAVHAGVAEASGLEFDAVAPFGIRANGPELLQPLPQ